MAALTAARHVPSPSESDLERIVSVRYPPLAATRARFIRLVLPVTLPHALLVRGGGSSSSTGSTGNGNSGGGGLCP